MNSKGEGKGRKALEIEPIERGGCIIFRATTAIIIAKLN